MNSKKTRNGMQRKKKAARHHERQQAKIDTDAILVQCEREAQADADDRAADLKEQADRRKGLRAELAEVLQGTLPHSGGMLIMNVSELDELVGLYAELGPLSQAQSRLYQKTCALVEDRQATLVLDLEPDFVGLP